MYKKLLISFLVFAIAIIPFSISFANNEVNDAVNGIEM